MVVGQIAQPEATKDQPNESESVNEELEEIVPMSLFRRRIAERLVQAQHQAALVTTFNEIDMTAVKQLRASYRESFQQKYGVKLGIMSFFVKAAVDALKEQPALNAEIRDNQIVYRHYHHIGIAIGSSKGLVVPVLRFAERLSFAEIEQSIDDFSHRANENDLQSKRSRRRNLYNFERRHLRFATIHAHRESSSERCPWNAHDSGSPRRACESGRHPADDVRRVDVRPSPHRRP